MMSRSECFLDLAALEHRTAPIRFRRAGPRGADDRARLAGDDVTALAVDDGCDVWRLPFLPTRLLYPVPGPMEAAEPHPIPPRWNGRIAGNVQRMI